MFPKPCPQYLPPFTVGFKGYGHKNIIGCIKIFNTIKRPGREIEGYTPIIVCCPEGLKSFQKGFYRCGQGFVDEVQQGEKFYKSLQNKRIPLRETLFGNCNPEENRLEHCQNIFNKTFQLLKMFCISLLNDNTEGSILRVLKLSTWFRMSTLRKRCLVLYYIDLRELV